MDQESRKFDLRQLECFCAVARLGSFTRAAEELGVAQSSVSEQIAKLEQGLSSVLFERLTRRIELTPAGEALLPRAQAMLQDAAALPQYLETVRTESGGVLRVGVIPTVLPYFLAPRLSDFVEKFPGIDLHLRECDYCNDRYVFERRLREVVRDCCCGEVAPAGFVDRLRLRCCGQDDGA